MPGKTTGSNPPRKQTSADTSRSGQNEGEGSQTGAREYNAATHAFVASGKVKQAAEQAERDISGPDAERLKKAESEGKKHSHGEDPLLGH